MPGSDETRTITGWRQATRYYRRTPGLGWLLALLAIPLLLGLLGWGVLDKGKKDVDLTLPSVSATVTAPDLTTPNVNMPNLSWGALSLLRNGNDVTLTGVLPNDAAKTSFLNAVKGLFGPSVNVIDNLTVRDGVSVPDLSGIAAALKPDVDIPDFSWKVEGDTIDVGRGKIKVTEFASSQLGNELQQQSALVGGVQEMLVASTTSLAGVVKEFGLLDFPFLFSNARQADAMVDGPLGRMLASRLSDKGIVVLGFFDLGFRNVTNSKRPITKAEDLDGLKLRVIPNQVFLETFKTFKANPVPMPFAELYGALESKAVDGQENPYAVILSSKLYEVNKFVSETNHVYATNPVQISKRFWDKLSPAEQKLLQDAATEAQNYQRVASREVAAKAVAASRDAALQTAERVTRREGADGTADTLHSMRSATGVLDPSELPIAGYDELNLSEAATAVMNQPNVCGPLLRAGSGTTFDGASTTGSGTISGATAAAGNSIGILGGAASELAETTD